MPYWMKTNWMIKVELSRSTLRRLSMRMWSMQPINRVLLKPNWNFSSRPLNGFQLQPKLCKVRPPHHHLKLQRQHRVCTVHMLQRRCFAWCLGKDYPRFCVQPTVPQEQDPFIQQGAPRLPPFNQMRCPAATRHAHSSEWAAHNTTIQMMGGRG